MSTDGPIHVLVLQEFELRAPDLDGSVARIVASSFNGREPAVPLLTSIDDACRVASLGAFRQGESADVEPAARAALEPYVASWGSPKSYRPRISERSQSPPSRYRLAVTESGINNVDSVPLARPHGGSEGDAAADSLDLLWIGVPVDSYAGLLILVGNEDDPHQRRSGPRDWPLPLSRQLGVRIYEGGSVQSC